MRARSLCALLCAFVLGLLSGCGGRTEPGDTGEQRAEEPEGAMRPEGTMRSEGAMGLGFALNRMELMQSEDPDNENLADLLQRNGSGMMVQIRAGGLLGSGVICGAEEGRLLILTAAHVLEEAEDFVLVTFAGGASVSAGDFQSFTSGDFAVVRVPGDDLPEGTLERCLCAVTDKESFDGATAGTGCIVMGCRTGVAAEAYEGIILDHWIYMEDYGQYMMWVKAEGMQGMSGGGLFDRQGHFLGILSGGNEDGELAVVPLSLILAEVNLPESNP